MTDLPVTKETSLSIFEFGLGWVLLISGFLTAAFAFGWKAALASFLLTFGAVLLICNHVTRVAEHLRSRS